MHEAEAAALGLRYEYRILDLIELGRPATDVGPLLAEAKRLGFAAMNITHPCKQLVLDIVDELDTDAARLRAVNLVVFDGERLSGYNTDWMGYRDGLLAGLPGGILRARRPDRMRRRGRGDSLRAPLMRDSPARPVRCGRRPCRRSRCADAPSFPSQTVATLAPDDLAEAIERADGVVHATPMGMLHHPGVAFDLDLLQDGTWVSDVVYRPLETELIRQAAERGHPVLDGGRMAVGQAYASLQIITGMRPDRDRMERNFRALIGAEERSGAGGGSR